RAIVEELASLGASVYTCARSEQDLSNALKEWKDMGFNVKGSICDASLREQRVALFHDVCSTFDGKLNIMVNNVGTNIRKPTVEYTAEDLSHIMSTNFESAYHNAQLAHPLLKASGKGNVVFVSSIGGVVAIRSGSLYAASKAAMNQITKNLACEWAKDGIRVNSVSPWYIKTDLAEQVLKDEEFTRQVISRTPLRRIGEPYEVASVVAFLCLPSAGF
ncbi:hypothetical protein L7F22_048812, partial [Adiantum nelumboides]|nr:hypothetical protein [Adiantum nelumboides]